MGPIGKTTWIVASGKIPSTRVQPAGRIPRSTARDRDGVLVVNTGDTAANVDVTFLFSASAPAGPYHLAVPPHSVHYYEFGQLAVSAPLEAGSHFCAVLTSDNPIVVQHVQHGSHGEPGETVSALAYSA